jgi:SAM-dependent methyltransferase
MTEVRDTWAAGSAYEDFMGRWSRELASSFVSWLRIGRDVHWLDVGCGTGALTSAICAQAHPASVLGCDPAEPFIEFARGRSQDARASFVVAEAGALPRRADGYGSVTSLLAMNFLPDPEAAVREMRSIAAARGVVSACVWDYAGKMEFLRYFWDAVAAVDSGARALDEGVRFPLCRADALTHLFRSAGLATFAVSRSRSRRSSRASMTFGDPSSAARVRPLRTSHRWTRVTARRWLESSNRLYREAPMERSLSPRAPGQSGDLRPEGSPAQLALAAAGLKAENQYRDRSRRGGLNGVANNADRNFILQQGLEAPESASCAQVSSALMFQPRLVALTVVAGTISQSPAVFAVLGAVLWWCALMPRWNPFEFAYNRTLGRRPGAPLLAQAPAPRRFAQGMAATFAVAIAACLANGLSIGAWVLQAMFLLAIAALAFGRFCLGSFVYHLWRGRVPFAMATLPWSRET